MHRAIDTNDISTSLFRCFTLDRTTVFQSSVLILYNVLQLLVQQTPHCVSKTWWGGFGADFSNCEVQEYGFLQYIISAFQSVPFTVLFSLLLGLTNHPFPLFNPPFLFTKSSPSPSAHRQDVMMTQAHSDLIKYTSTADTMAIVLFRCLIQ